MKQKFVAPLLSLLMLATAPAQELSPGALSPGESVQVEYIPDSGQWLPGKVLEVLNDGYSYKVSVQPYKWGRLTLVTENRTA